MFLKATAAVLASTLAIAATVAPASAQHWRGGGYHHHRGSGVGAGIAGFAAGALIGGALASQSRAYYPPGYAYASPGYGYGGYAAPGYAYGAGTDDGEVQYCQSRYRSYDPSSGTYLGYDGQRHPCP